MAETIKATDDSTVVLTLDKPYAPTFLLYCLTSGMGSVVDKKLAMEHEKRTTWATRGSRPTRRAPARSSCAPGSPREVMLDANPDYWRGAPKFKRVITRHIPERATQRLLLEQGDIDIARKLSPEDMQAVAGNQEIAITRSPKGAIWYLGLNQKNEPGQARGARGAEVAGRLPGAGRHHPQGQANIHQSYLPKGFLGAIEDQPISSTSPRARSSGQGRPARRLQGHDGRAQHLADQGPGAGHPGELGEAGVEVELIPPTTSRP